jgi:hypothetical protein
MTIHQALYYYAAPPLLFVLGYLLGRLRKPTVPADPYLRGGSGAAKVGDTIHVNANTAEEAAEFIASLEKSRETKAEPRGDA